jgi:hypothetical protein
VNVVGRTGSSAMAKQIFFVRNRYIRDLAQSLERIGVPSVSGSIWSL